MAQSWIFDPVSALLPRNVAHDRARSRRWDHVAFGKARWRRAETALQLKGRRSVGPASVGQRAGLRLHRARQRSSDASLQYGGCHFAAGAGGAPSS
jgi:hypothetical protein